MKEPKIRFEHWWFRLPYMGGSAGFVFYPWVMFKRAPYEVSVRLFRHELEHVYQVRAEGWLKFYLKWLFYTLRYGYRRNPYEVEARARESDPLTEQEQGWFVAATARYLVTQKTGAA